MSDPLDDLILKASADEQKAGALRSSMSFGMMQNPDERARAQKVAGQLGTTPQAAQDNLSNFEKAGQRNAFDFDGFIKHTPKLATWTANPENAAVAHDDMDSLKELEHAIQDRPKGITDSEWQSVMDDRIRQWQENKGKNEVQGGLQNVLNRWFGLGTSVAAWASTPLSMLTQLGGMANKIVSGQSLDQTLREGPGDVFGDTISGGLKRLGEAQAQTMGQLYVKTGPQRMLVDKATGKPFINPDSNEIFNRDLLNTVEGMPADLLGMWMTGGMLSGKVFPAYMAADAMENRAKAAAAFREANGMAPNALRDYSEGAVSGALNWFLMTGVPHAVPTRTLLGDALQKTTRAAVLGPSLNAAENLLAGVHGESKPVTEGAVKSFVHFLPWELQSTLPRLIDAASTSKLKARSPETFRKATESILKDSGIEQVMIPADRLTTFFQEQGLDPIREAERLGARNYAEALAAGTDVVIPTADFLTKLKPEQHQALLPDLRTQMGGLTARESEAYQKDGPERVAKLVAKAKAELPDEQFQAFTSIKGEIQKRLEATGRFTPVIAEDNATLLARGLVTQSQREGLDPVSQFEKYGLNITGPGGEGSPMRPPTGQVPEAFKDIPGLQPSGEDFTIPTSELTADPSRFQYKGKNETTGLNQVNKETGASGSLHGVKVWNPDSAGTISAWRDPADGKTYVVNGHNRYDLAKKLGIDRLKVRFIDAKDAGEAKIAGAIQNIAAGKGTAMDAASLFRDGKYSLADLERLGIPTNKDVVVNGLALSRLSDPWYAAAKSDPEFERLAVETGKSGLSKEQQGVALQELNTVLKKKGAEDITSAFWRDMLDRIKGSQVSTTMEQGLFGSEESYQSTLEQQTDLVRFIRGKLRTDKTVGQVLTGGRYEEAVGKAATVDKEAAAGIKQDAGTTLGTFEAMKNLAGVGDVINEFAARLQQARSAKDAESIRQEALGAVKDSIKEMTGKPKAAPMEEATSLFQKVAKTPEQIRQEAHDLYNDPRTVEEYNALPDAKGGKLLNVDIARRLDTNYRENPTFTVPHHHKEVSAFIKRIFAERMAQPVTGPQENVIFMAGGGGSGKGSAAKAFDLYSNAHTIVDGTMKDPGSSKQMIDLALDKAHDGENSRPVSINLILRDVDKAVEGTILRGHTEKDELGRFVGIDQLAGAHEESPKTILNLMDDYGHDPLVRFRLIDNKGKPADINLIPNHATRDYLESHINTRPDVAETAIQAYHRVREHGYEDLSGQRFPITSEAKDFLDSSLPAGQVGALDGRGTSGAGRGDGQGPEARPGGEGDQVTLNHEPGDKRGSITFGPDNKVSIAVLEKANASTFVHELGHFWVKMLGDLADRPESTEQTKADLHTILKARDKSSLTEFTTEDHEWLARAHEAYLREGKAPSQALQGPFARFKTWLSGVYQRLTDLNVNLSDDVRGVFDRIYASDREIESAKEQLGGERPIFESAEKAGMTPAAFEAYRATRDRADETAKGALVAKLNREGQRDQLQWWKDELGKAREEVAAQVDADPVQTAFRALADGHLEDGTEIKLSKQALVDQFGPDVLKYLPRHGAKWIYDAKGNGMDAETAAEILGFKSGQEMIDALKQMAPRNELIKANADLLMKQRHGDMLTDGSIAETALEVLHNADREKALLTELKALRKLQAQVKEGKTEARATVQEVPPIQAFRDAARELVNQTSIRDLQPYTYLVASRKAAREAFSAMAKDDYQAAGDAKQKELLNHHLYLEATKAKTEAGDIAEYGREGQGPKLQGMMGKAGQEYRGQWNALASRYEFRKVSNLELDARAQTLAQWVEANALDGAEIDPAILQESQVKNWREVPLSELRAVKDALKNIETVARAQLGATLDGKRLDFEMEAKDLDRVARENNGFTPTPRRGVKKGFFESTGSSLQGFNAYMQKMEWFINKLDGGDINGPARKNIKKPIDDASGAKKQMTEEVKGKLFEVFKDMTREERTKEYDSVGVQFPSMDRPMNRLQLISWALNLGTEENWKVAILGEGLMGGDGALRPEFDAALSKLTAKEAARIQGIWDALESMRPAIIAKETREKGYEPKWKNVTPLSFTTSDGVKVDLKGGYYPLKADSDVSNIGRRQDVPLSGEGTFTRPGVSESHTKEVSGATYPLLLDYPSVIGKHVPSVINNVTMGEAISYVSKFIMRDDVSTAIKETIGLEREKEFLPWLQSVANDGVDPSNAGPIMNWLMKRRMGMSIARLGGNVTSYLVQAGDSFKLLAAGESADYLTHLYPQAMFDIARDPKAMIEEIRRLSPNEMRFREQNGNREVRDILNNRSVIEENKQEVAEFVMSGFMAMDHFQTFPAWLGKFREGLAKHGDEAQAVMEADRLIARTFQAGEPRNLAKIMRGNEGMKLLTSFQGDANTWYGILSNAFEGKKVGPISVALMALIAEQMVAATIRQGVPKKEDLGKWSLGQMITAFLNPLGPFGDFAQYGISKLGGTYAQLNNPTTDAIAKLFALPAGVKAYSQGKKDAEGLAIDSLDAIGMWAGIPFTGQVVKSWRYQHNVRTGKQPKAPNPASELWRTLTGPPAKENQ